MMTSELCNNIFGKCVEDYHVMDDVSVIMNNPFAENSFENLLYLKCWIDTVQWHLEDIVRDPSIEPSEGLLIKRKIDASNQQRTDVVEKIDDYFLKKFENVAKEKSATINTESPAWAIDRLSILAIKIYHMNVEANRPDASDEHRDICKRKLDLLIEQRKDLSRAIDQLLDDISKGKKYMKVYRQMKMYNDPALNPVLYQQQIPGNNED